MIHTIRGILTEINKMDTGDWFIDFKWYRMPKYFHLWATDDIGQRLDYLFRYEQDYAPAYTGTIIVEVFAETGQIIDFRL